MEIKVEEIKTNDEIIYACNGDLRKVRVVRPPRRTVNKDGSIRYGSALCEYKLIKRIATYPWDATRTYERYFHLLDEIEDPAEEIKTSQVRVDFNYKNGWLLKREEL